MSSTTGYDRHAKSLVISSTIKKLFAEKKRAMEQIEKAERSHGMPWRTSMDPSYEHDSLFYMPFWEWQLDFMKENLSNLRVKPTTDRTGNIDLTYVQNTKRKKRMITLCFESDEYRLIRLTLMDAGTATQVFTSVWFPRSNLPILGVDFLQFNNQTRHLTIVDFQPVHASEADHDASYEHLLEPIRSNYPNLQNRMSDRFYDEDHFFSNNMLMGKGDQPEYVWEELMPAYKEYVKTHVHLAQTVKPELPFHRVLQRQKAYDDYSSVRDPAHGLLAANFGKDFADPFVYDVLFPLSDGPPPSKR